MTARHLLEGVMQHTKARSRNQCAMKLGLDVATVHRIDKGVRGGINIATLDQIQRISGVPFDTLFGWYRLPADAVLGRVSK